MSNKFVKHLIENRSPRLILLIILGLMLIFGINSFGDLSSAITAFCSMIINFILMLLIMGSFLILSAMMLIRSEWNEHVQ